MLDSWLKECGIQAQFKGRRSDGLQSSTRLRGSGVSALQTGPQKNPSNQACGLDFYYSVRTTNQSQISGVWSDDSCY